MKIGRGGGGNDSEEELRPIVVGNAKGKPARPQPKVESNVFDDLDAKDIFPFPVPDNPRVSFSILGCLVISSSLIGLWATGILSFASAAPEPGHHASKLGRPSPAPGPGPGPGPALGEVPVKPNGDDIDAKGKDEKFLPKTTEGADDNGDGGGDAQGGGDDGAGGDQEANEADKDGDNGGDKAGGDEALDGKAGGGNGDDKQGGDDGGDEADDDKDGKAAGKGDDAKEAEGGDGKPEDNADNAKGDDGDGNAEAKDNKEQETGGDGKDAGKVNGADDAPKADTKNAEDNKDDDKQQVEQKTTEDSKNDDKQQGEQDEKKTTTEAPKTPGGEVAASGDMYSVVIDAGSTGSRINVFRFGPDKALKTVGEEPQLFKTNQPGISSCASDLDKLPELIKPLMDAATEVVPEALRASTPLALRATAGLRFLGQEQSDKILDAVRNILKPYGFKDAGVEVMDGSDEGSLQWLAINFLLGAVGKADAAPSLASAVDLGGGSMQVVYGLQEGAADKMSAERKQGYAKQLKMPVAPGEVSLYQHSYLGFGLMAMRAKIFEHAKSAGVDARNPCLLADAKLTYKYNDKEFEGTGVGNATACKKLISQTISQPSDSASDCDTKTETCMGGSWGGPGGWQTSNTVLCSFFFDRLKDVGIIENGKFETEVTIDTFRNEAAKACALTPEAAHERYKDVAGNANYLCMDLSYLDTVLTDGLGFSPDAKVSVKNKISLDGRAYQASWALGVALLQLAPPPSA